MVTTNEFNDFSAANFPVDASSVGSFTTDVLEQIIDYPFDRMSQDFSYEFEYFSSPSSVSDSEISVRELDMRVLDEALDQLLHEIPVDFDDEGYSSISEDDDMVDDVSDVSSEGVFSFDINAPDLPVGVYDADEGFGLRSVSEQTYRDWISDFLVHFELRNIYSTIRVILAEDFPLANGYGTDLRFVLTPVDPDAHITLYLQVVYHTNEHSQIGTVLFFSNPEDEDPEFQIAFTRTDNGFLVGVEPNPGPDFCFTHSEFFNAFILVVALYYFSFLAICFINDYIFRGEASASRILIGVVRETSSITWKMLYYIVVVALYLKYNYNKQGFFCYSSDFLVGIETNPGPDNFEFLKMYIKNNEKESLRCASSSVKQRQAKRVIDVLNQKKIEKNRDLQVKIARDLKFIPQGLMDFGIDNDSKEFLQSLVDQLKGTFPDKILLEFDFISSFDKSFSRFFEYLTSCPSHVSDMIFYFFSVIKNFVSEKLAGLVNFIIGEHEEHQPQSLLTGSFLMLAYKKYLSKYIAEADYKSLIKTFVESQSVINTMDDAIRPLLEVVTSVVNYVLRAMGFEYQIPLRYSKNNKLNTFYDRFSSLRNKYRSGEIADYDFAAAVFSLQEDLEYFVKDDKSFADKDKHMYLIAQMRQLVAYCEQNINPNNGPRVEPLGVLIAGPSGVGKSTLTLPILLAFLARVLPKELVADFMSNHNDFIFFRANENEFWDGYKRRHWAIVYDDFGQRRDTSGNPNPDAFEIIRLINSAPYHMHFSSIEDKAKHFAQPKVLFGTTNRNTIRFDSIVSNEAVVRRFHYKLVQVPKLKYSFPVLDPNDIWSRRLDLDKVRKDFPYVSDNPETFFCLDAIEFHEWDFIKGCLAPNSKVYGFEDLVEEMVGYYTSLSRKGGDMLSFHQSIKAKFVPQAGDVFFDAKEELDIPNEICVAWEDYFQIPFLPRGDDFLRFAKFFGVVCGALFAVSTISKLFTRSVQSPNSKVTSKEVKKGKSIKVRQNRFKTRLPRILHSAQGGNVHSTDFFYSILKRNIYVLKVNDKQLGFAIFVKGTTFVVPRHFEDVLEQMNNEDLIADFISPITGKICFSFAWYDEQVSCSQDESIDLMFVHLPSTYCRMHSDISRFFLDESKVKHGDKFEALMPVMRGNSLMILNPVVSLGFNYKYNWNGKTYSSSKLEYSVPTIQGDCGSFILTNDARFSHPVILGFHTAARNSFSSTLNAYQSHCLGVSLDIEMSKEIDMIFDEEDFVEEFVVQAKPSIGGFTAHSLAKQPRMPVATKLMPSKVYGKLYQVKTKPAYLKGFYNKDGEYVDVQAIAREKYSHDETYVPHDIVEDVYPNVKQLVLTNNVVQPWKPRLFSFDEAVDGINGVDFCNAIDRTTSPGYPYNLDNIKSGKKDFLGEIPHDKNAPKFGLIEGAVKDMLDKAKRGIRSDIIYLDCLKDERRPIEKVEMGKTRQFMASPLDYTILVKMYFGDFIRYICSNRIKNGIAVGIDPMSEWDQLLNYMQFSNSVSYTAGDYSSFDCKIRASIELYSLRIIEDYYYNASEEDRKVRKVLFQDIVNSRHIQNGVIYEFVGSNPSGNPLTAVLNSICNIFMLYVSAKAANTDVENDILFNSSRVSTFGDDNIISYLPSLEYAFEQNNIAENMRKCFDIDYTVETKDGSKVSARNVFEISFLKRMFKIVRGRICAPLELDVILETLNWMRKDTNDAEFNERFDAVLVELSMHGKDIFDKHAPLIVGAAVEYCNYHPKYTTFDLAFNARQVCSLNF